MIKETNIDQKIEKYKRIIFYMIMLCCLVYFIFFEIYLPSEQTAEGMAAEPLYHGTFTWERADGQTENIEVPGQYEVETGTWMVIRSKLPEDYAETSVVIRSSLQNVRIFVGGELRTEYNTENTRPFGRNSASGYVFCPTSWKDAGKELRIELQTYADRYSGVVNAVYSGEKADIWKYIYDTYGESTVVAFFILFAGVLTVAFSIVLELVYKTRISMEALGWCMILGAVWLLGESKLRQLFVWNASVLAPLCFVTILLCPIPVLSYVNHVQEKRYQRWYQIVEAVSLVNFFVCTILQLTGREDYIDTLPVAQGVLGISFLMILITVVIDIVHGEARKYRLILIGLLAAMAGVAVEAVSTYFVVSVSGFFVGTGLLVLLMMTVIVTMGRIRLLEERRHQTELEKRRRETEKVSIQMMQTLSLAIEAKNPYTRGHSERVGEYAALIAAELGWSREEIANLKNAAYFHDIGKVGIPDAILNKPLRLTPEEYEIIKNHTMIGADILKDVTLIKHADEVARYHHERYDGKGYPEGLCGEQIPVYARIVTIADSYDAMNTRRIYRNRLPKDVIRKEFEESRGTQFDPEITDVVLKLLKEDRFTISVTGDGDTADRKKSIGTITGKFLSEIVNTMREQDDTQSVDFLTGLPVRTRGEKEIAEQMAQHDGWLVFLDMDNLKHINDIYGHRAGDRVLQLLGELIQSTSCNGTGCRLGGDEFLLYICDRSKKEAEQVIKQLFDDFNRAKDTDAQIRKATLSAGICKNNRGDFYEECYTKADKALYYVKQNGKNHYSFYQEIEKKTDSADASGDLAMVVKALCESGNYTGALDLDYRGFARIYEYMRNLNERYESNSYLVMITLEATEQETAYLDMEDAMEAMGSAIRKNIRKVDICTRYSSKQYLVILMEAKEPHIPEIMERIFTQYRHNYMENDFTAYYNYTVVETEHRKREYDDNTR